LLGMKLISSHLQGLAKDKITAMLGRLSGKKLASVGLGAGASFVLQSSTATTVVLLGLVNAGMVDLMQATLIIMGANVGTTFTVLIFSFTYLPIGEILSLAALAGVFIVITAKKEKTSCAGWVISGFGLIFIGLGLMSGSVEFLKTSPAFARVMLSLDNPFILVFAGVVFAALAQSSSATTAIVITLAQAGLMPMTSAFAVIMGSNVGTCVTAMLASLGSNLNTKRTAMIHLLYNAAGVIFFFPVLLFAAAPLDIALTKVLSPSMAVAYFHILFNVATTLVLLPFARGLAKLSTICIPEKSADKREKKWNASKIMIKNC